MIHFYLRPQLQATSIDILLSSWPEDSIEAGSSTRADYPVTTEFGGNATEARKHVNYLRFRMGFKIIGKLLRDVESLVRTAIGQLTIYPSENTPYREEDNGTAYIRFRFCEITADVVRESITHAVEYARVAFGEKILGLRGLSRVIGETRPNQGETSDRVRFEESYMYDNVHVPYLESVGQTLQAVTDFAATVDDSIRELGTTPGGGSAFGGFYQWIPIAHTNEVFDVLFGTVQSVKLHGTDRVQSSIQDYVAIIQNH